MRPAELYQRKIAEYQYYHQQGKAQEGKKTKVSFLIYPKGYHKFRLAENVTRHSRQTS